MISDGKELNFLDMETKKEEWIDGVLGSLEGANRAKPSQALEERILAAIEKPPVFELSSTRLKMIGVAASLLVAFNAFVCIDMVNKDTEAREAPSQKLISNYKIYE